MWPVAIGPRANYNTRSPGKNTLRSKPGKGAWNFNRNEELFKNQLISDSTFLEAKNHLRRGQGYSLAGAEQQVEWRKLPCRKAEDDLSKNDHSTPRSPARSRSEF